MNNLTDNPIITLILAIAVFVFARIFIISPSKRASKAELDQCFSLLNTRLKYPKEDYSPSQQIYERFCNDYKNDMNLTAMATDILKHCGYKPAALYVAAVNELPEPNIAGRYQIKGHASTIQIKMRPFISKEEVLAILIHECMHFFLRCRNISFPDTNLNEKLTDVTSIYMGFYSYMMKGYINGGYISRANIKYVKKTIRKYHSKTYS